MSGRIASCAGGIAAAMLVLLLAPASGARAAEKEVNGFVGGAPGTAGGHFLEPRDATVYRRGGAGKILVVEGLAANSRVQRLDADGNFELAWGRDVVRRGGVGDTGTGYEICSRAADCKGGVPGTGAGELALPSGIAVNDSTGIVYVVDGGNGRVQRFTLDGRVVGEWSLAIDGTRGRLESAAIAISPVEPHDVFVGDDAANRVLQFDAEGEFLRAWGWGVATGSDELETCTEESGCRAGRRVPGLGDQERSWPRHLAIDDDGVVYSSPFLGVIFEDDDVRARIYRFRSDSPPDPPSAEEALLRPLVTNGEAWGTDGTRYLTDGATLGLDLDPRDGRLLAINNPFGTSKLDEVRNPGGEDDGRPTVDVADELPFLQNISGIAADDGVTFLVSGKVVQRTGPSGFTGCARDDARRDCHGLIAIAAGGPPRAVVTAGVGAQALIDPSGVATYRFEVSRDGRRWRSASSARYAAGDEFETAPAHLSGLERGIVYKVRLVAAKKTDYRVESTTATGGFAIGAGR